MTWVSFVGEGRSGHTVISGILGSHPNALISEEQKYISKWLRGHTRDQIMTALKQHGGGITRRGQGWPNLTRYTEPLTLIGDKCGWDAVNEYKKRGAPVNVINEFESFIGCPVKVVVTMRHPLDNISSWASGNKYKCMYSDVPLRFRRLVRRYKQFHDAAWDILQTTDYKVVYHEELIAKPSETIQDLADWLGLPDNRPWRRASANRIWSEPRRRRDHVEWPKESLENVERFIESHSLLEYYR